MKFDFMRCTLCQHGICNDCNIQEGNEGFKYVVQCTNIIKYWSLFCLIIGVSPLDGNGFFTLSMAKDIIDTENLDDISPRVFWETMSYFLSRKNHKLYLDRKRKNANNASKNKRR
jgi:hypothetical protein